MFLRASRVALLSFLIFSLAALSSVSADCVTQPTVTEGPYYSNTGLVRQNITEGKPGIQLKLFIRVLNSSDCEALLSDTYVDLWHCDAVGLYSAFTNNNNPAPAGSTFLRGLQPVNSTGWAEFHTIFPGWYVGRDTHIHYKIRLGGSQGTVVLTGQLFVNDTTSDEVNTLAPYSSNTGQNRVQLEDDNIYVGYGLVDFNKMDESAGWAGGMVGTVILGVSTSGSSTPSSMGGRLPPSTVTSVSGPRADAPTVVSSPAQKTVPASASVASAAPIATISLMGIIFFCGLSYFVFL